MAGRSIRLGRALFDESGRQYKWTGADIHMATIQQTIADKFLAKLAQSKVLDAERIDEIRGLLGDGKKVKAEDLVRIFSLPPGGDLT
jgi:hypothetical protein